MPLLHLPVQEEYTIVNLGTETFEHFNDLCISNDKGHTRTCIIIALRQGIKFYATSFAPSKERKDLPLFRHKYYLSMHYHE